MADPTAAITKDTRHLTFSEGSSHKFWKIELDGSSHTVTYGRIGTAGQSQTKDFKDDDAARKSFDKLIAEKTQKGYVDAAGGAVAAPKPAAPEPASHDSGESLPAPARPTKAARSKGTVAEETVSGTTEAENPRGEAQDAPPSAGDVDLRVHREIRLDPEDWFQAGFRPRPALQRKPPRAFDKEACLERLSKLKTTTYGWDVRWADLKLPATLSPEEAHFWLVAMTEPRGRDTTMSAFATTIGRKRSIDGKVSVDDALDQARQAERGLADEVSLALANLLSPEDHLEMILKRNAQGDQPAWRQARIVMSLIAGFRKHAVPYLSDAQRQTLRARIRKDWDPTREPSTYCCFPAEYYLAAALGMHDAVYEVTSHWADDRYGKDDWHDQSENPQELVFGLGSAELVASEWKRLKLKLRSADHVRSFLACTEYAALDNVAEAIVGLTDKNNCEALLKTFALVLAPEAAEPMLQCKLSSRAPAIARDWLDKYVGCAVTGLIDTAGGRGQLADAAIEYLRVVKRKGMGSVLAEALKTAKPERVSRVQVEVLDREDKVFEPFGAKTTPEWLSRAIEVTGPTKRTTLPAWAAASVLPPLTVGDKRLSDDQVDLLLQRLAMTPVGQKHPLFTALRENVPKSARDEFAWKMFQCWQEGGFPPKEKWAMGAIAHVGDDGCVLKLTPRIRAWPGESQHARAVFGLECLRAIGSSVALMQLAGIAQKLKFKGLKAKAEEFVEEIAKERGLTRDELEDRVVPDCGLDENGRREFPFGPRSFSFVLGGDLKAMVRDEAGKLRPNLPDPNAKDDAELARDSVDEWKLLKKQIKEVATIQAGRLEQAMITGRRWDAEDFETLLVRHPLMTHLAQKLIWAGFDATGKRVVTFRVTEERDHADPEDEGVSLDGVANVGIVHPLELTDAERGRWGEVLGDYEVVPPFPQLGRTVYALESGEESAAEIKRFHGTELPAPTLVFTLEKLGWTRGMAMDAGCFDEHSKQFPSAKVTAVIAYEGTVGMGYIDPGESLTVKSVHFCKGLRVPSGWGWDLKNALKLGEVPPIVISEVLADLHVLKSKAK
jgi:predicted DNA-binding WGR domain protein